jgi:RNA polymerase sigma-70 factor, ECF subfamily
LATTATSIVKDPFRLELGRAPATLACLFGDIDLAEKAVQQSHRRGRPAPVGRRVPPTPGGWIFTTARHQVIDPSGGSVTP